MRKHGRRNIGIVGIGGMGNNAIHEFAEMWTPDAFPTTKLIPANTDQNQLDHQFGDEASDLVRAWTDSGRLTPIPLGTEQTGGDGTGFDPKVGKAAMEESLDSLVAELKGMDAIVSVFGLGGGTGTGGGPVLDNYIAEHMPQLLAINLVTLPRAGEGRTARATAALEQLRLCTAVVENNRFPSNSRTPKRQANRDINQRSIHLILKVWNTIIQKPGNVKHSDLNDMRNLILLGSRMIVGYAELPPMPPGEDDPSLAGRLDKFAEELLHNPFQDAELLKQARAVYARLNGELAVCEFDGTTERIRREIANSEQVEIVYGERDLEPTERWVGLVIVCGEPKIKTNREAASAPLELVEPRVEHRVVDIAPARREKLALPTGEETTVLHVLYPDGHHDVQVTAKFAAEWNKLAKHPDPKQEHYDRIMELREHLKLQDKLPDVPPRYLGRFGTHPRMKNQAIAT